MRNGVITGCILGVLAFCVVYPPAAWPLAAIVGTLIAFTGDATRG